MFKFQIIFLSFLISTLQAAEQEVPMDAPAEVQVADPQKDTLSRTFLIKGYETVPVTVADYTKYKMLEILDFQGPEGDTSPLLTGTIDQVAQMSPWSFPDFITPEIMRYLEDLVTCNTQDHVNWLLEEANPFNHTLRVERIKKYLPILFAAHYMEVQNPHFDFTTITRDAEKLKVIKSTPSNFMHLVIANLLTMVDKPLMEAFLQEYPVYVKNPSQITQPLLLFLNKHKTSLIQIMTYNNSKLFLDDRLALKAATSHIDNFIQTVNNQEYIPVKKESCFDTEGTAEEISNTTTLCLHAYRYEDGTSTVALYNVATEKRQEIYSCEKDTSIKKIAISKNGKYILIITETKLDNKPNAKTLLLYQKNDDFTYALIQQLVLENTAKITGTAFNNNETHFFIADEGTISVYEIKDSNVLLTNNTIRQSIRECRWSPDNSNIAFVDTIKIDRIHLWNIYTDKDKIIYEDSLKEQDNKYTKHKYFSLCFNTSGSLLLYGSKTNDLGFKIYNTTTNEIENTLPTSYRDKKFSLLRKSFFIDEISIFIPDDATSSFYKYNTQTNTITSVEPYKEKDLIHYILETTPIKNCLLGTLEFATYRNKDKYLLLKQFSQSYIDSLPFIDLLFLAFCVKFHGYLIDDPVLHQHYFDLITEQFDPVTRTISPVEKDTPANPVAQDNAAEVQQQPSFIANAGAGAPPKDPKGMMREARLQRFDTSDRNETVIKSTSVETESSPSAIQEKPSLTLPSLRKEIKEEWEGMKTLFQRTKNKIGLL